VEDHVEWAYTTTAAEYLVGALLGGEGSGAYDWGSGDSASSDEREFALFHHTKTRASVLSIQSHAVHGHVGNLRYFHCSCTASRLMPSKQCSSATTLVCARSFCGFLHEVRHSVCTVGAPTPITLFPQYGWRRIFRAVQA
jgi:hypothetical protein